MQGLVRRGGSKQARGGANSAGQAGLGLEVPRLPVSRKVAGVERRGRVARG